MTIKEYIRLASGDTGEEHALTDAELSDIIAGAVISPTSARIPLIIEKLGAEAKFLNRTGWLELSLEPLDSAGVTFGCGVGGFLETATDVLVDGEVAETGEDGGVNHLTGVVTFAIPPGGKVSVRTYLVDAGKALHNALMAIAGSEARLAIRAAAAGASLDTTALAGELRKQAREALGSHEARLWFPLDYPH